MRGTTDPESRRTVHVHRLDRRAAGVDDFMGEASVRPATVLGDEETRAIKQLGCRKIVTRRIDERDLATQCGVTHVDGVGQAQCLWPAELEGGGAIGLLQVERPAESEARTKGCRRV